MRPFLFIQNSGITFLHFFVCFEHKFLWVEHWEHSSVYCLPTNVGPKEFWLHSRSKMVKSKVGLKFWFKRILVEIYAFMFALDVIEEAVRPFKWNSPRYLILASPFSIPPFHLFAKMNRNTVDRILFSFTVYEKYNWSK